MEKHSKLDPFKDYIVSRLNEYSEITSVVLFEGDTVTQAR